MSRYDERSDRVQAGSTRQVAQAEPVAPGKTTLTASLPALQRRLGAESPPVAAERTGAGRQSGGMPIQLLFGRRDPAEHAVTDVHEAARRGIAGSGGSLPHLARIQQSFGRHDVSHVQAHTDGHAAGAANAIGAEAYACGDHVAFAGSPTLHTAAHEAAHVVQQRSGVALKGGVGEVGDAHEQHADAVADLVVQGKSAESLLDQHAGGGRGASPPVQAKLRIKAGDGEQRVQEKLGDAQEGQVDPYVAAIFRMLQTLAGAQSGRLRLSDAGDSREVLVDPLDGAALTGATPGFQLLQRVIQSAHPVVVDPWTDDALNNVRNEDISKAKQAGVGVGSTVAFPWKPLPQSRVRTAEGGTESRDTPMEVALGHELIHADHAQRGVWRGDDKTLKHFSTGAGERGDYAIAEEMDTVGLGATRRAGDITENDLRTQLGHEQRVSYHAPEMFETLKARAQEQQKAAAEEFQRKVAAHNAWHKSMQVVWAAHKRKDK